MQKPPTFSIIVITQNRPEALGKLLDGLASQQFTPNPTEAVPTFEVIVVEDLPEGKVTETTGLLETRRQETFPVEYLRTTNAGPGLSRNVGADKATGETLIFLEDRCIVPPGWLDALAGACLEKPEAGIRYGPIASTSPPVYPFIHSCQMEDTPVRAFNIAFRREAFQTLGGYDPNLSYWAYEWDMVERAKNKKMPTVFVSEMALEFPPHYQSPEYFNFSKLMRIIERSGYLMKKHPESEEIMQNFLLFRFQALHFLIRLAPLLLLFFFSPVKTFIVLLFYNVAYDALRLLDIQWKLMKVKFSLKETDAVRYLMWNWSLDFGLFMRQLLLIPYRFC